MPRGGRLPRPVLRFRGGTALRPFEALSRGLGPLRGPSRLSMACIFESRVAGLVEDLLHKLIYGYRGYGGLERLFGVRVEVERVEVDDLGEGREKARGLGGFDVALVAVPDSGLAEMGADDFYAPLKSDLAMAGIPSQMVNYSTLRYCRENPYVLFNLALGVYGKAGGVPWGLAEPLACDAAIGIDVTPGYAVASVLVDPANPRVEWSIEVNPEVEVAVSVKELVLSAIYAAAEAGGRLRRVVVHRDGRAHWSEVEGIREAIGEAKREGLVEGGYAVLEVRKRCVPRIVRATPLRLQNPEKGVYAWLGEEEVLLATTGYPERPLPERYGLVRPLVVSRVDASSWDESPLGDFRDVFWLSQLHWGSAFATPRLPITTLYAHRICGFLGIGVYPPEEYRGRLWFL